MGTKAEYYSDDRVRERIIKIIEDKYGANHNIKIAMFKACSQYNDEYDYYENPLLILVDEDYNETTLNAYSLVPTEDDMYEAYEQGHYSSLINDNITIKF